ncbi:MAG TPA: hypothetical protein VFT46_11840 [Holophagaceae bacterium]|nr:hypothetical protein [Holophagaceae bacterium]
MKIELMVFEGCPNAEPARLLLRDCMASLGISGSITEVQVDTPELAKLLAFPGSPTLRVNDADVAPLDVPMEGSLACRTYWVNGLLQGLPDRAWVLRALRDAQEAESHSCCTPITASKSEVLCPYSGTRGKPVKPVTLRALLKPHLQEQVRDQVYRFCGDPTCEVVYFSEDRTQSFLRGDLTVRVGIKESEAPRPLCYCFSHSVESIRGEYAATGESTVVQAIRAEVKAGTCRCEITNPGGSCCLGDVTKAVKEIQDGNPRGTTPALKEAMTHDCCAVPEPPKIGPSASTPVAEGSTARRTVWAAAGLGLLASACCWIPLALAGAGAAGGAAGARVAWLRPWALWGLALLMVGTLGWWIYRHSIRGRPQEDCCAPAPRFPALPMLVLVLSFIGAWSAPRLLFLYAHESASKSAESAAVTDGGTLLVLSTPQFDCPPCAGALPETMAKTPGVASVHMDFDKRETRIQFREGANVPGILAHWDHDLGFSGKVILRQP